MLKTLFRSFLFCVAFLAYFGSIAWPQSLAPDSLTPSDKKIVKAVEIKGNRTINVALILSKIKTRVGEEYLQTVISDDLKRLYNTGYFSDVSVDRQDYQGGFKVMITVVEKPIVEKITFTRTRYVRSRTMEHKIQTKQEKFLDSKVLKDDVKIIKELYAKKGLTDVTVDPEVTIDEVTNKAKIHFVIKEGQQIRIRRITVSGNKAFRAKKIISLIKTRAKNLFNSGFLKEDLLEEDMERIASFYEKNGFIDAKASYALADDEQGRLVVNIAVEEGRQYFVEDVVLVGYHVLTEEEIRSVMKEIKAGSVFSREKLSVDVTNIQALYFDKGYIFAKVTESTSLNAETGKVDVKLEVREGDVAYVHRIKIQGNMQTRDIVIRRELTLNPGERFDGVKLRRSKEKLKNLGYFEDISYDIEDTDAPNKKDLVVEVKETKTGTFSFGGGFSTIDRVVGFVEIEQKNFDFTNWPTFTGGGQDLLIRAEIGSVRNNLRLSFTEPWFFDYPVAFGFDAFRTEREKRRNTGYIFDEKRIGGDVRLGKRFTDLISGLMVYRNESVTIDNFDANVSADLKAEEGKNTVSGLGFNLTRDARDSIINPTQGLFLSGDTDVAGGILGGDKDFYRLQSRASYYVPLKFNSVLEFRLRGGIVKPYGDSEKVPIFERFFAGGARTIRGYEERKVGPIDSATNDPIGGEALVVGNIEYVIPLVDFLKMATFFDSGNVWSQVDDFGSGGFKSGAGVGLRIKTPIGPVSLDYGFPLNEEPGEEKRSPKFYFNVSRGF